MYLWRTVKNEIIGVHPIPAKIQIPMEMGKSLWSYEKKSHF